MSFSRTSPRLAAIGTNHPAAQGCSASQRRIFRRLVQRHHEEEKFDGPSLAVTTSTTEAGRRARARKLIDERESSMNARGEQKL